MSDYRRRAGRPPAGGTRFTDVRVWAEVDSTNRLAADLVRTGVGEGLVVVAGHQTAGRGRRGRSWEAPPGAALLVSVVLHPPPDPGRAALVTMACALAAADACCDAAGFAPDLKWPNDLVVDERKLAGVLAEVPKPGSGAGPEPGPVVVVGLGLNVRWPGPMPAHLRDSAVTAEAVAGRPVDTQLLLDAYLSRLEVRCGQLGAVQSDTALIDDYRRRCVTLGRQVRVELPGEQICEGRATDVNDDGSLRIASDSGMRCITVGDVVHLR